MKTKLYILSLLLAACLAPASSEARQTEASINFDFYGEPVNLPFEQSLFVDFTASLSEKTVQGFYQTMVTRDYSSLIKALQQYKEQYRLDDWLYYQLIRKTAQHISPKAANYHRYTLYKWFLLTGSGYDAILSIKADRILFYVQTDENIYNIPGRLRNGKQYICLNYHDYGIINFEKEIFTEVIIPVPGAVKGFSYKVTHLPDFNKTDYQEKEISFNYNELDYHFKLRLNPQIKTIFANYPVVDYESYFNIPLSKETYSSLIPDLKKHVKGMNQKNGIDFLMRFTRYAFLFEPDSRQFGNEKRLSPEQTLLYEQSDCDDRAALFFCLVKEIYNLPMIVLAFPEHVTIAVRFDKPVGTPIIYNGEKYSVCEPTPQKQDLKLGQLIPGLNKKVYEVAYAYTPRN
ncbi:MAG: hypothetical protein JNK27_09460 [Chitinophagaceae bacterium]|nr:hypothetical protein [Chitinophagaceae bacterium]